MIKEQTPYFAHDFNATMDPKVQDMLFDLGPSGFVYWAIIETLWQQQGRYPLAKIRNIALIAHAKPGLIERVIKDYGLFEYDDTDFWSPSQIARQEQRNSLIKSRQEAGRKGGKKKAENQSQPSNEAEDKQNYSNAKAKVEQTDSNKLNKTKLNDNKNSIDIDISSSEPVASEPQGERNGHRLTGTKQVAELWNNMVNESGASLPLVVKLTEARKKKIQVRWKEFAEVGDPVEVVKQIFANACGSKFFQGDNKNGWSGSFDWLFENSKNWVKTYEGNYDDRPNNGNQASGFDRLHVTATKPEDYEGDF